MEYIDDLSLKFEAVNLKIGDVRKKTVIDDAEFENSCAELVGQVDEKLKKNFSDIFGAFLKEIDFKDN